MKTALNNHSMNTALHIPHLAASFQFSDFQSVASATHRQTKLDPGLVYHTTNTQFCLVINFDFSYSYILAY